MLVFFLDSYRSSSALFCVPFFRPALNLFVVTEFHFFYPKLHYFVHIPLRFIKATPHTLAIREVNVIAATSYIGAHFHEIVSRRKSQY